MKLIIFKIIISLIFLLLIQAATEKAPIRAQQSKKKTIRAKLKDGFNNRFQYGADKLESIYEFFSRKETCKNPDNPSQKKLHSESKNKGESFKNVRLNKIENFQTPGRNSKINPNAAAAEKNTASKSSDETSLVVRRHEPANLVNRPIFSSSIAKIDQAEISLLLNSAQQVQLAEVMIVITADGKMHGLDRITGQIIWTQPGLEDPNSQTWKNYLTYTLNQKHKNGPGSNVNKPESNPYDKISQEDFDSFNIKNVTKTDEESTEFNYYEDEEEEWLIEMNVDWTTGSEKLKELKKEWSSKVKKKRFKPYHDFHQNQNDNSPWFLSEPTDQGRLFMFDTNGKLVRLPLTITELVSLSPVIQENNLYFGNKDSRFLNLDIKTGSISPAHKTDPFDDDNHKIRFSKLDHKRSIQLGESTYRVKLYTKSEADSLEHTHKESNGDYEDSSWDLDWEFAFKKLDTPKPVSELDIAMIMAETTRMSQPKDSRLPDKTHCETKIVITADGHISLTDANSGIPLWVSTLNSTAIEVFDTFKVNKDFYEQVSNFNTPNKQKSFEFNFETAESDRFTDKDDNWMLVAHNRPLKPIKQQERFYLQKQIKLLIDNAIPNHKFKSELFYPDVDPFMTSLFFTSSEKFQSSLSWLRYGLWDSYRQAVDNFGPEGSEESSSYDNNKIHGRSGQLGGNTTPLAYVGSLPESLFVLSRENFPIISKVILDEVLNSKLLQEWVEKNNKSLSTYFGGVYLYKNGYQPSKDNVIPRSEYYHSDDPSKSNCEEFNEAYYPWCMIGLHNVSNTGVSLIPQSILKKQSKIHHSKQVDLLPGFNRVKDIQIGGGKHTSLPSDENLSSPEPLLAHPKKNGNNFNTISDKHRDEYPYDNSNEFSGKLAKNKGILPNQPTEDKTQIQSSSQDQGSFFGFIRFVFPLFDYMDIFHMIFRIGRRLITIITNLSASACYLVLTYHGLSFAIVTDLMANWYSSIRSKIPKVFNSDDRLLDLQSDFYLHHLDIPGKFLQSNVLLIKNLIYFDPSDTGGSKAEPSYNTHTSSIDSMKSVGQPTIIEVSSDTETAEKAILLDENHEEKLSDKAILSTSGSSENGSVDKSELATAQMETSTKDIDSDGDPKNISASVGSNLSHEVSTSVLTQGSAPNLGFFSLSQNIIGYGSHGTVVYLGYFENRPIAVKRLLLDYHRSAKLEIQVLQEADLHPNVIRYYYSEMSKNFLYIALELCAGSISDAIEIANIDPIVRNGLKNNKVSAYNLFAMMDPKRVLYQMTLGLHHLHQMKLVHRDLKPQNILISLPVNWKSKGRARNKPLKHSENLDGTTSLSDNIDPESISNPYTSLDFSSINGEPRIVISDFGLSRILEDEESSFFNTINFNSPAGKDGNMIAHEAAGTVGWRAPECLNPCVFSKEAATSKGSNSIAISSTDTKNNLSSRSAWNTPLNKQLKPLDLNAADDENTSTRATNGNGVKPPEPGSGATAATYDTTESSSGLHPAIYSGSYGNYPSNSTNFSEQPNNGPKMTRKMDIFSLGCVFYFVLTNGKHPFGSRYSREQRILKGDYDLSLLHLSNYFISSNSNTGSFFVNDIGSGTSIEIESSVEALDLIEHMIQTNPKMRPSTHSILVHPYFWSSSKRLLFLQDISDKLESYARYIKNYNASQKPSSEQQSNVNTPEKPKKKGSKKKKRLAPCPPPGFEVEPEEPQCEEVEHSEEYVLATNLLADFEKNSSYAIGKPTSYGARGNVSAASSWEKRLDKHVRNDLGSFRKYNFYCLRDLLRVIRNKKHHYQDLDSNVQQALGDVPNGFCSYFEIRFPHLLLYCYYFVLENDEIRKDPIFQSFFEVSAT